jgi:hypothetical protein
MLFVFYTLLKLDLKMSLMQLNEFHKNFDFKNLRRHCFKIVVNHSQTLILHFNNFRRRVYDVVQTFLRRVLND